MTVIIKGWEFLTDINPGSLPKEQSIQKDYLNEYNLAYTEFLKELLISEEELQKIKNDVNETKYKYIIDLSDDNNIINKDSEYPIKFLKSKFLNFKNRKLKSDLIEYYKPLGFFIKGPFELINNKKMNKYYIELFWQSEINLD